MKVLAGARVPIKVFVTNALGAQIVPIEDQAEQQLFNLAKMPFVHSHIAAMPDVHWGMGATVGSVIATVGAIIPAAVGVDIGCGMMAVKTDATASDLPKPDATERQRRSLLSGAEWRRSTKPSATSTLRSPVA
jgi:tRNA-splicing ligase RtcB (3'-phosphate/5'-hydroxy nucleic acid ligase)